MFNLRLLRPTIVLFCLQLIESHSEFQTQTNEEGQLIFAHVVSNM